VCLAFVGLSDGHSDQQMLRTIFSLWNYVDVRLLVNTFVYRNSSLLFTICFTDAVKFPKCLFLQFQYKTYFIVHAVDSQLFWLLRIIDVTW
jgi:hypothetical protein